MKTSVWINVFVLRDGSVSHGGIHASREAAEAHMGPPRKWYWGRRPAYRLRVTIKDPPR